MDREPGLSGQKNKCINTCDGHGAWEKVGEVQDAWGPVSYGA